MPNTKYTHINQDVFYAVPNIYTTISTNIVEEVYKKCMTT